MSDLDTEPAITTCGGRAGVAVEPVQEILKGRTVPLGESTVVRRLLPNLGRRMVGAWCFLDHYGPDDVTATPGMQVGPHPHMGLQTVTWLLEGTVLHRDSLGSLQLVQPGQLGLMTAGRAIAHAEQSPPDRPAALHGAQLWVALPDDQRDRDPSFEFHAAPPVLDGDSWRATVMAGEFGGNRAPGTIHSPLVGVDVAVDAGAVPRLELEPDFEYAAMVASGAAEVDGVALTPGALLYLGCGRPHLDLQAGPASRILLLGGEPFAEQLVMWWNFVARSNDEIADARQAWMETDRFGTVVGFPGDRVPAPTLPPGTLKPRGRTG